MSVVRKVELGQELSRTLAHINQQIEVIKKEAEQLGVSEFDMRDANSTYVMSSLLAAKAQTLHALVLVNQR